MRHTLTALACLVALAAAAGCGESEQEQAREVAQDYAEARTDGDYAAVCELFSENFVAELQTDDCPAFIKELLRRVAQWHLEVGNPSAVAQGTMERALDEMLFSGGALNTRLLGGA